MNGNLNKMQIAGNALSAWAKLRMRKLRDGYCHVLRILMPKGECWQAELERDEMQRQMLIFRDELEATKFWERAFKYIMLSPGLTKEAMQRELTDYYWLMQSVGRVYYELTEGKVTQQATKAEEVLKVAREILVRQVMQAEDKLQLVIDARDEEIEMLKSALDRAEFECSNQKILVKHYRTENKRILDCDLTPEEFQNLCHNLHEKCTPAGKIEFAMGCIEFQKQIFGESPLEFKK